MTTDSKRGEKPTLLSKRVLRTNRVNVTEAVKLKDRLGRYKTMQQQKSQTHEEDVDGLRFNLRKISRVKDKMEVSVMRRKFLAEHGISVKVKDVNMDEFVSAVEGSLRRSESARPSSRLSEENETISSQGQRAASSISRGASTSSTDTFPLHLPLDLLAKRNKGKHKCTSSNSDSLYSDSDSDNETDNAVTSYRPKSGRFPSPSQFRIISPPTTGRRVIDVYKELEEEEKIAQKVIEEKKFQERLKKNETWKSFDKSDTDNNSQTKKRFPSSKIGTKEQKTNIHPSKRALQKVKKISRVETEAEETEMHKTAENRNDFERERDRASENLKEEQPETNTKTRHKGGSSKMSNLEDEFDALMNKYLQLSEENKQRPKSGSAASEETNSRDKKGLGTNDGDSLIQSSSQGLSSSKDGFDERRDKSRNRRTAWSSSTSAKRDDNEVEEKIEEKIVLSPSSEEWKMLVDKTRADLKTREATFRSQTPPLRTKSNLARKDGTASVDGQEKIMAKGNKSVMKGYATMQMTVGKRAVSIFVPRFESEAICKGQAAGRANVKSCFEVEQVREKRELQKKRSFTLE